MPCHAIRNPAQAGIFNRALISSCHLALADALNWAHRIEPDRSSVNDWLFAASTSDRWPPPVRQRPLSSGEITNRPEWSAEPALPEREVADTTPKGLAVAAGTPELPESEPEAGLSPD